MPRQQYYLNPFQSRHDKGIQDTQIRYEAKPNCQVATLQTLPYIEDTSTLLIDGHCSSNQPGLASDGPGAQGQHNPEVIQLPALSNMLIVRLPKTHIKIRLLGCYGGIVMARFLAIALGLNDFHQIAVGGYTESVFGNDDPNGRMKINLDRGVVDNTHNSVYVRWFNNHGQWIAKPNVQSNPALYNPAFPT